MLLHEEDRCHTEKTDCRAYGTNQQQGLAAKLVNDSHSEQSCGQIHRSHENSLQIAGHRAESTGAENIVQVVNNGVDACQLIEHANRYSEENRQAILVLKQRLRLCAAFKMDRIDNLAQLRFRIG